MNRPLAEFCPLLREKGEEAIQRGESKSLRSQIDEFCKNYEGRIRGVHQAEKPLAHVAAHSTVGKTSESIPKTSVTSPLEDENAVVQAFLDDRKKNASQPIQNGHNRQVDDDLFAPTEPVIAASISPVARKLRELGTKLLSPFDSKDQTILIRKVKESDLSAFAFILTARFTFDDEKGQKTEYNIGGKRVGGAIIILKEGREIRVFDGDRALCVNKDFKGIWRNRAISGAMWFGALHLVPGREFVMWLNGGGKNGDIEKKSFKVNEDLTLTITDLI